MDVSPDLAAALAGAYLDRANIHADLCAGPCCCGMGTLLADLVDLLLPGFADAAAGLRLEGKPFFVEDHPGLLPEPAASRV